MATKIETGKVYHCQSPMMGVCSIQVLNGGVKIKGSNVTEYDPDTRKLLVPTSDQMVDTGDNLAVGLHLIAGLPEWFEFEAAVGAGTPEVWIKMGVDARITPADEREE